MGTRWLLLLLLLLCIISSVVGHGGMPENFFANNDNTFNAYWEVSEGDEPYATFEIKGKVQNGWVALGFGEKTTDYVIGYLTNETHALVTARHDITSEAQLLDNINWNASNNVLFKPEGHMDKADGLTVIIFNRFLNPPGSVYYNLENPGDITIKWAYGNVTGNNTLNPSIEHGEKKMPFVKMEDTSGLKSHGVIMVLVVMIFMTSGIIMSRYMKTIFYWWFYVHAAIFIGGMVFMIASVILIFKVHGNVFVAGWHSAIGLMFVIVMCLQTLLGFASHFMFDVKRHAPPFFPDKIHWFLGRLSFGIGIIAILLGFDALGARTLAWNSFWLWIVVIFFLVLTMEKYIGQTHEMEMKGIAEDDEAFDTTRDEDDNGLYVPKKGNSLSISAPRKQLTVQLLLKILIPAALAIFILFILVAAGINSTEM